MPFGRLSVVEVPNQEEALKRLARLVQKATIDPAIRRIALTVTAECADRDDECELEAIYDAVKHGDDRVRGLENGVRYVSDPRYADHFTSPARLMDSCKKGACAEDCDGQAALVAALAGAVGFKVGLRAYGPKSSDDYNHVYAVGMLPKRRPDPTQVTGIDQV